MKTQVERLKIMLDDAVQRASEMEGRYDRLTLAFGKKVEELKFQTNVAKSWRAEAEDFEDELKKMKKENERLTKENARLKEQLK